MNSSRYFLRCFGGVCLLISGAFEPQAWAHGEVHGQIVELTRIIEKDPTSALLYLRRGALHRAHQDWDSAHSDYDLVAMYDPSRQVVDLGRGKSLLDAGWPMSAETASDRLL